MIKLKKNYKLTFFFYSLKLLINKPKKKTMYENEKNELLAFVNKYVVINIFQSRFFYLYFNYFIYLQ